jgi:hypothetical protein
MREFVTNRRQQSIHRNVFSGHKYRQGTSVSPRRMCCVLHRDIDMCADCRGNDSRKKIDSFNSMILLTIDSLSIVFQQKLGKFLECFVKK